MTKKTCINNKMEDHILSHISNAEYWGQIQEDFFEDECKT